MAHSPAQSDSEICFLYAGPSNGNKNDVHEIFFKNEPETSNAVRFDLDSIKTHILVGNNGDEELSDEYTKNFSENESYSESEVIYNAYDYANDDGDNADTDLSDGNVDDSMSRKQPFDYVRQYCEKCDKTITRQKSTVLKICRICATSLLYECVICERKYKVMTNIFSHLKSRNDCRKMPDLFCSVCDYTNIHKGFMLNHVQKHANRVDDSITCQKCGRHFKRAHNAEEHELSCGGVPYLECTYCDFKTTYGVSFKVHRACHIVDPENGPALVDENFEVVNVDPLSDHSLIWASDSLQDVKNEIKNTLSKKSITTKTKVIDLYCRNIIKMFCYKCKETKRVRIKKPDKCQKCDTILLHECGLCASKFNTYQNILRHLRDRHAKDNVKNCYVCGTCDKNYESFKKLMRHETLCIKVLRCGMCPFTAKINGVLRKHVIKWHYGPAKAWHQPCLKCGRQKRSYKGMLVVEDYCGNCSQK